MPLWLEDRQEVLASFLKYGRVIPPEEFDKYKYDFGCDPPEVKPKLEEYQKEVLCFSDEHSPHKFRTLCM